MELDVYFKLTNIICVIQGTIQTRSKYLLSLEYFPEIRSHGGRQEGEGLRLSIENMSLPVGCAQFNSNAHS